MGLETGDFIDDLVITNPGSNDPKSEGDDHLRLIKKIIQQSFPNFNEALIATAAQIDAIILGNQLTGMIAAFCAAPSSPALWQYCDGSAISRTTFATLFANIGITYGDGDASTTFNVPDYRGQFLRAQDDGEGVDPDAAGRTDRGDGTTGDNLGTKQGHEFESHDHITSAWNGGSGSFSPNFTSNRSDTPVEMTPPTSLSGGNETRPVNVNVQYWIHI